MQGAIMRTTSKAVIASFMATCIPTSLLAEPILAIGSPAQGSLDATDQKLPSGTFYDSYAITLASSQAIEASAETSNFVPRIMIFGPNGFHKESDVPNPGQLKAELLFKAPEVGAYQIAITSLQAGAVGGYKLSVNALNQGTSPSVSPVASLPTTSPLPTPAPLLAQPLELLNPTEVVLPNDYPVLSRRNGDEGTTRFKIVTSGDGRIRDCSITLSSGHPELDAQTCTAFRQRAKFRVSGAANEPNGLYAYSQTVRWIMPASPPRPLFLGTKVTESTTTIDGRTRCKFSDGLVLFVAAGAGCTQDLPFQQVTENGIVRRLNIVDTYLSAYARTNQPAYAFNIAAILTATGYNEAIDYYLKASDGGIGLASYVMCAVYANPDSASFNLYKPKSAVRRCIMAHEQGIDAGIPLIKNFLSVHPEAATEDEKQSINARSQLLKKYTSRPAWLVPGGEVVRPKDYPKDALRKSVQGRTLVLFRVNTAGRADDCIVLESSLSYSLDEAACRRIREAGSFTPAIASGQPSPMWISQGINWKANPNGNSVIRSFLGAILGGIIGAL